MNTVLLLMVFATPVAVGALIGWWQWFIPRRRLNRIFAECRRARLARLVSEQALEQALTGVTP